MAARRLPDADVPAGAEATVLGLDEPNVRVALSHEIDGPVARAVVDDYGVVALERVEAVLDPGQRVVRHDHRGDATGLSHARLPGAARSGAPRAA